jgi:Transcriptional regulator, AbiEi antitoxin
VAHKSTTPEDKLARLASRAHGVVTRAELLRAGVTSHEIVHRVRSGSLIAVFRGVYRVGHRAPSLEARYMAAAKAAGEGSVLSGLAAAQLFGLIKGTPPPPEVSAATKRRIKGVKTRRRRLDQADKTVWRGIPTTTLQRTLIDLSSLLSLDELAAAFHQASVRHRLRPEQVEARVTGRLPGAEKLRRVLRGDAHVTLSELERAFLRQLRAHGLPLPITNRAASGRYVDCRWPKHKLTVELDSYRYHNTRHSWERDRRREREAYARGDQFRRYTYGDVTERPESVLTELRPILTPPGSRAASCSP